MANIVYCDTNDLCQNNYYFALSTPSSCNPTNLPTSHTGIADSGASGIYFASNAPVANLNPTLPPLVSAWQTASQCSLLLALR
jgi:hypothetical protein